MNDIKTDQENRLNREQVQPLIEDLVTQQVSTTQPTQEPVAEAARGADMIWKTFSVCAFIYFSIAVYGSYSTCRDAGGVLVMGIGWFVCAEELKEAESARGQS